MQKPSTCVGCTFAPISTSFSRPDGKGRSGVVIIGEAADHDTAIDGVPYGSKSQAGSKLKDCIEENGLSRDDFLYHNIISCQPPIGAGIQGQHIDSCKIHWQGAINRFQPPAGKRKVILALGNTAFQVLTGETQRVDEIAGYPFPYTTGTVEGKSSFFDPQYIYDPNVIVLGTHHPVFIKRGNNHLTPLLTLDIKKAVQLARNDGSVLTKDEYQKKARYRIVGHDEAYSFLNRCRDNSRLVVSYDIETADSGYHLEDEVESLGTSTDITQIQFATDKYNAVVFPNCDGVYGKIAKEIIALQNLKMGFNVWNFDNPIMRTKGFTIEESQVHDLMWMFKQWQPKLPRGLQRVASLAGFPFAWKHLFGADIETYCGADVTAPHFILEWLVPLMKKRTAEFIQPNGQNRRGIHSVPSNVHSDNGNNNHDSQIAGLTRIHKVSVWTGYNSYVYKLHPHLSDAAADGFPVNDNKRLELKTHLLKMQGENNAEIQKIIPDEIRKIAPKRKLELVDPATNVAIEWMDYGFLKTPKAQLEEARGRYDTAVAKLPPGQKVASFEKFLRKQFDLVEQEFETWINKKWKVKAINPETGKPCWEHHQEWIKEKVVRWVRIKEFKASKEQLSGYIEYKHETLSKAASKADRKLAEKYKVPKDHKGKETTKKDEIEMLFDKTGDELLQKVLYSRSLTTNIRNYIPNWEPNPNTGCVHTTWGFTAPSGQINSYRPNVLNVSKHTEIGQAFRGIIEAPEGWSFLEADKKSFHVATMGYCANNANYIRFSQIDPHSIFASHIVPSDWGYTPISLERMSDTDILAVCKGIKKRCKQLAEESGKDYDDIRQKQAKPTVLGNQLGLGPDKLWWMNRRSISSRDRAVELQTILSEMFDGKIEEYKQSVQEIAYKQTYLMNEFGFIEHYFDVFNYTWSKTRNEWVRRDGDEARNPVAFRVQGCAFGMIKDELFRIQARVLGSAGSDGGKDRGLVGLTEGTKGILNYRIFRSSIHDSLVFMHKDRHKEAILGVVLEEMNKPCDKLVNEATGPLGLMVGVEWTSGRNLQSYHKEKNPEGMKEG